MLELPEKMWESYRYRRTARTRVTGSAGAIAFIAGLAMAGQAMVWLGWFEPGQTSAAEVLSYWPGFLLGGLLLGVPTTLIARKVYDWIQDRSD